MRDTMFRFCYRALQEKGERVRILRLACADPTVIDLDLRFDLMSSTADRASCWPAGLTAAIRSARAREGTLRYSARWAADSATYVRKEESS